MRAYFKTFAAAAGLASALLVAPTTVSSAAAASTCTPAIIRLPDLGYGGGATAFNGTTVVGLVFDANGRVHPAIWRRGKLTVLHRKGIGVGVALDINARGDIVGTNRQFSQAWELRSSTVRLLRHPPGSGGPGSIFARESYYHQITDNGTVAGTAGPVGGPDRPFMWTCAFQQAYLPPVPDAPVSRPAAAAQTMRSGEWQALRREAARAIG